MSNPFLWIFPAEPDDQGSFCDSQSGIHYNNLSKREAEDAEEAAMRRGDQVIPAEYETHRYNEAVRFNVTQTDVDDQGYEHPAKHRPGR